MGDQSTSTDTPSENSLRDSMVNIAARSHRLVTEFLAQHSTDDSPNLDPLNIGSAFLTMSARLMSDPAKLVEAQMSLWQNYVDLWRTTTERMLGGEADTVAAPARSDRRFRDPAWEENEVFNFIKQSYLLTSRWLQSTVSAVEGLDEKTAQKVDFYTRQFTDAMSPSNFLLTNPEVLRATLESGGENLVKGLKNLLDDLERGKGKLQIRMTDTEAFKVGQNIAVTPGQVIYRNQLMEIIQYNPTTETADKAPLLIIPPWINKYYILDLRPDNSFIRWAVQQGHTVFVVSWVNPDANLAGKTFSDYMLEGPIAAMDAIQLATGERRINVIGYCIGGTLLACTLAYLKAKGDDRVLSATFFTTLVDFSQAGELSVFIDEEQLTALEQKMAEKGYLEGREMATTFNMLRANDLIWSFVVNNYLLGKEPFPFDLLYWNSDSTRMPAAMHKFYLRKMYQENKLVEPGGVTLDGVPIDLTTIETPVYIVATREDHIAPWKSAYLASQIYSGSVRFVLAASGHIAGVVNHPAAAKYSHWTNNRRPKNPDAWLKGAEEHAGSWWPNWDAWAKAQAGNEMIPARHPGDGKLSPIEPAPGAYVLVTSD